MPCMVAPLCGRCSSPISEHWAVGTPAALLVTFIWRTTSCCKVSMQSYPSCTQLLRSPSSTVAGEAEHYLAQHPAPAATPAVDWWRENEQHFPSVTSRVSQSNIWGHHPNPRQLPVRNCTVRQVYTDCHNRLAPKQADVHDASKSTIITIRPNAFLMNTV